MTKKKIAGKPSLLNPKVSGFAYCPGCQEVLAAKIIAEVIEELEIGGKTIGVFGIGCSSFLINRVEVDAIIGPHGRPPDMATGIKRIYPENLVFSIEGDGGLISIGGESLLGALTRAEKITIFMLNNAVYGTTGGQMAPTTLPGQVTSTSPTGRDVVASGFPAHAAEMIATFKGVVFSARGALISAATYKKTKEYIKAAFQKQIDNIGLSYVEILSACPTNWHLSPVDSLQWIEEKMVEEFPLGVLKNVDKIE
jgi:2-oxoglutarate ferredoxin oxidoreductase subunit beta